MTAIRAGQEDAIPSRSTADLTRIECSGQSTGGSGAHTLGHRHDDDPSIGFGQQAPLGHGATCLQRCRQIQAP
jgi:hypothetical protein